MDQQNNMTLNLKGGITNNLNLGFKIQNWVKPN